MKDAVSPSALLCVTHSEGVDGGAHFLHVPLHRKELLIEWTAAVPQQRRLQDEATATVGLKESCIQLHWKVWRGKREQSNLGNKRQEILTTKQVQFGFKKLQWLFSQLYYLESPKNKTFECMETLISKWRGTI